MKKKLRVAVLANIKANAPHWDGMPKDRWADLDSEKTVNALVEAVRSGGYEAEFLEGDVTLMDTIRQYKPNGRKYYLFLSSAALPGWSLWPYPADYKQHRGIS